MITEVEEEKSAWSRKNSQHIYTLLEISGIMDIVYVEHH